MKKILIITFTLVFGFTVYANFINEQGGFSDSNSSLEAVSKCLTMHTAVSDSETIPGNSCYCAELGSNRYEGEMSSCRSHQGYGNCNKVECTGNPCCYSTGSE